jgi:hypothetical protein
MFKIVKWNKLIKKKYLIYTHYYKSSMKFTGIYSHTYENRVYFYNVKCYNIYKQNIGSIYFTKVDTYYDLVSVKEKIQEAMEKRALDKILRKLIGDQHFEW